MKKILTIIIDEEEETLEEALDEVRRLIAEGYTSGINPQWEIITK